MNNKVYTNNMSTIRGSYKITGHAIQGKYTFLGKVERGRSIFYNYTTPKHMTGYSSNLWVIKSRYSSEEIQFIEELFSNLNADNLSLIKAVIHSKYIKDGEL